MKEISHNFTEVVQDLKSKATNNRRSKKIRKLLILNVFCPPLTQAIDDIEWDTARTYSIISSNKNVKRAPMISKGVRTARVDQCKTSGTSLTIRRSASFWSYLYAVLKASLINNPYVKVHSTFSESTISLAKTLVSNTVHKQCLGIAETSHTVIDE